MFYRNLENVEKQKEDNEKPYVLQPHRKKIPVQLTLLSDIQVILLAITISKATSNILYDYF